MDVVIEKIIKSNQYSNQKSFFHGDATILRANCGTDLFVVSIFSFHKQTNDIIVNTFNNSIGPQNGEVDAIITIFISKDRPANGTHKNKQGIPIHAFHCIHQPIVIKVTGHIITFSNT